MTMFEQAALLAAVVTALAMLHDTPRNSELRAELRAIAGKARSAVRSDGWRAIDRAECGAPNPVKG